MLRRRNMRPKSRRNARRRKTRRNLAIAFDVGQEKVGQNGPPLRLRESTASL